MKRSGTRIATAICMTTVSVLWSAGSFANDGGCKPLTPDGLKTVLADQKVSHLVFFASWCSACKKDLEHHYENPVFISSFDTLDAANKAFSSVPSVIGKKCFFDTDNAIAKSMNIAGLPYIKDLRSK